MGGGSSKNKESNDIEKGKQGPKGSSSKKNNVGIAPGNISRNSPVKGG